MTAYLLGALEGTFLGLLAWLLINLAWSLLTNDRTKEGS